MRISDWSSDVCSSDLVDHRIALDQRVAVGGGDGSAVRLRQIRDGGFDLRRAEIGGRGIDEIADARGRLGEADRSEEHTSELQSLMRISYADFCLKKKKIANKNQKY